MAEQWWTREGLQPGKPPTAENSCFSPTCSREPGPVGTAARRKPSQQRWRGHGGQGARVHSRPSQSRRGEETVSHGDYSSYLNQHALLSKRSRACTEATCPSRCTHCTGHTCCPLPTGRPQPPPVFPTFPALLPGGCSSPGVPAGLPFPRTTGPPQVWPHGLRAEALTQCLPGLPGHHECPEVGEAGLAPIGSHW